MVELNLASQLLEGLISYPPREERLCLESKNLRNIIPKSFREAVIKERKASKYWNPNTNIKQVSYAVGYRNVANFDHDFRRLVGLSPGEYRTQTLS